MTLGRLDGTLARLVARLEAFRAGGCLALAERTALAAELRAAALDVERAPTHRHADAAIAKDVVDCATCRAEAGVIVGVAAAW